MKTFLKTNPTDIIDIDPERIVIRINRKDDASLISFSIEIINLEGIGLPKDASVILVASSTYNEVRISLGEVSSIVKPKETSLLDLESAEVDFRLFLVLKPNPRIIASCESPEIIDEISGGRMSLFSVHFKDLGERMWELGLNASTKPIIRVHNNPGLGVRQGFELRDYFVRGLILPAAVEQTLMYLIHNPASDENLTTWQNIWTTYLEEIDEELPDLNELNISQIMEWSKHIASIFSNNVKFASKLLSNLEEK